MKPKQALVLLAMVAAVIAGIAVYKLAVQPRLEQKSEAAGVMFPGFDPAKVDRVEVASGATVAVLVRQGDSVWAVESAKNYPADADAIERALDAVKALRKDLPASENKDNHGRLGVDDKGLKVKLLAGGAAVAEFVVGNAGSNYGTTYVRPAGADAVYLVSEDLKGVFPAGSGPWRDKAIFDLAMEDINEIRLWTDPNYKPEPLEPAPGSTAAPAPAAAAGGTAPAPAAGSTAPATPFPAITPATPGALVIKKTGPDWTALPAPAAGTTADGTTEKLDPAKVDALARALATLAAVEFADTVTPAQAGTVKPQRRLEFTTTDGKTLTLFVGKKGQMDVYVQRGDGPTIFRVYPYSVDNIFKTIEELRPLPGGADAGSMLPPPNMPGMGMPGGAGGMPPDMVMPGMPEGAPPAPPPAPAPEPAPAPAAAPGGSVKK